MPRHMNSYRKRTMTGIASTQTYEISTSVRRLRFLKFMLSRKRSVVMINFLVFREKATGAFEGRSGWEAAQSFLAEMDRIQTNLGWRNVWTGRVELQLLGEADPTIEVFSLIEYPSPRALLRFITARNVDMSGRDAGLLGQLYVHSTTEQEPDTVPQPLSPQPQTDWQARAEKLGISEDRFAQLMRLPADQPLELVQLLRFDDQSSSQRLPEGNLRWRGNLGQTLMGLCEPPFNEMTITRCEGPQGLLEAPRQEPADLQGRWAYGATTLSAFKS